MHSMNKQKKEILLKVARDTIRKGAETGARLEIDLEDYDASLSEPVATFVTLYLSGELAGCIGSLEAARPLVEDVAANAYSAAFSDHRFQGIQTQDLTRLGIEIALLSPLEPIVVQSEAELKQRLIAHKDGLLIEAPGARATFLPKVWQSLPNVDDFVKQLKIKAGLAEDFWSDAVSCFLYRTETFADV